MNNADLATDTSRKWITIWLFTGCAMVMAMVIIGGITRLTGSGLSITEWNVVMGTLPPQNEADWQVEFEKYKASPEFIKVNHFMQLADFKEIFWWEYLHRLVARIIGFVFIIPFIFFLIKGWVNKRLLWRLILIFFLGGFQGFLGWYMVKSGLVDNPHVSQYRLTAHLISAFSLCLVIFWVALEILNPIKDLSKNYSLKWRNIYLGLTSICLLQIGFGGLVAGLKAGYAFPTFPLMQGEFFPSSFFDRTPVWKNFFENHFTVQFVHRWLGIIVATLVLWAWFGIKKSELTNDQKLGPKFATGMVILQILMGIGTLLLHIPIWLAVAHQAGALILLIILIYCNFHFSRSRYSV